jgi:hypothetical protein
LDGEIGIAAGESEAGGAHEPSGGDGAAGGDAPQSDLHHILTAVGAVGLHHVGQLATDAPLAQRREAGAQHLAVQRVGQPHRGAAPRRHDRDEAARLQRLQPGRAVDALEVGQAEALAHGQELEHGQAGAVDARQVLGHELVEYRRRRQRRREVPHAARLGERAALTGAADELGQQLQVPSGQAGQLVEGLGRHRAVEGPVEQRLQLVGRQRLEVHPHEVPVPFEHGKAR